MQPERDAGHGLERFRRAKRPQILALERLADSGTLPAPLDRPRPSFRSALHVTEGLPAVIAEYKRASPSRGIIALDLDPADVAAQYATAGASCLSVLTEEVHFRGRREYLFRMEGAGLPMLRKDFIFHPLQVAETAATPASALLLIVRLTPDVRLLRELREQAERFGLDAVVEIDNPDDLALARDSGARIIQVNSRDLATLIVDRSRCLQLAQKHRAQGQQECWIAASGMSKTVHLREAADSGFDAALLGTALMQGGRPGETLATLLHKKQERDRCATC